MLLLILPFAGGCLQSVTEPVDQPTTSIPSEIDSNSNIIAQVLSSESTASDLDMADDTADDEFSLSAKADVSNAAITFASDEIVAPANIHPGPGMIQIIKLADSGVEESVMMAFVTNSADRFNLGPEEIIYLNDIGISPRIITAMLQRDHILQAIAMAPPVQEQQSIVESVPPDFQDSQPPAIPVSADYAENSYPAPGSSLPVPPPAAPLFYDSLAPYGSWVDVDGYGRCWQPTIVGLNPDWQPYFDGGRWVYTDCGWYWKSDYSWGWAAFHYGRWFRHARLGWCWCPDDVWGPSWVCWRSTDDYCGWAPLPPGAGFTVAGGLCFQGRPCPPDFGFGLGWGCFRFVATHDFCDNHVWRHAVPRDHIPRFFHHTVVSNPALGANHRVVNDGVSRERIVAAIRHDVQRVTLRDSNSSSGAGGTRDRFEGNGRTLAVFRPHNLASLVGHSGSGSSSRQTPQPSGARAQSSHSTLTRRTSEEPNNGGVMAAITPPGDQSAGRPNPTPGNRPAPLILRGPSRRSGGQDALTDHASRTSAREAAQASASLNARGQPGDQLAAPRVPAASSLAIIGRRGGNAAGSDHHSIHVFTTPPADASAQAGRREQHYNPENVASAAAWSPRGGFYSHSTSRQITPADQEEARSGPPQRPYNEVVPWWLTRANQNQGAASPEPSRPRSESPLHEQQHFEPSHVSHAEARQQSHEQHQSASARQESSPPPAARESHSEAHSAPAAAPSSAPASHSSSSASQSSSGRR